MQHLRTYVAMTATAAALALGHNAFAQDDLDDLLADLEGNAPSAEKAPAAEETPADEAPSAEEKAQVAEAPAAEAPATEEAPAAEEPVAAAPAATSKDAELIDAIRTYEELRRGAMDAQAMREIEEARASMEAHEFLEAVRHFNHAYKLLNDRPGSKVFKDECNAGIAEGLYRAALEEDRTGRRDRAIKLINQAVDRRHPKARRQLEAWNNEVDPDKYKTDVSEITHRKNEAEYKVRRERERKHLKRARQLLANREIDRALDECELVLVADPYNQEAIRLRDSIQRKRSVILKQERDVTREAMIADVDEAWRPVYAVDARELDDKQNGKTVTAGTGPNGERSIEQEIVQRMKDMRLPAISFKPPATIIDAVEYFRGASKDFDRPDIPIEKRGFNFVLKTPEAVRMKQANAAEGSDDFSDTSAAEDENGGGPLGVPVIPMITASDITFYDALKLVCESVDYKFSVQGPIVMVMQKDMSTAELVQRAFPVLAQFIEKVSSASEDITTMGGTGFGANARRNNNANEETEEDDEERWKKVFTLVGGVQWPEGSSIYHMKTIGKLFVNNTQENLAKIESVLNELGGSIKLVEIETRFVEVCQDDLNSLGFEWILNSDYTLGLNKHLAKALGVRGGGFDVTNRKLVGWDQNEVTTTTPSETPSDGMADISNPGGAGTSTSTTTTRWTPVYEESTIKGWSRVHGGRRTAGVNTIPGVTDFSDTANMSGVYSTGQRYLSTLNNHISGQGNAYNDQFMRLNAFLGNADVSMILHMLAQRSDTDLLSAPKVLTRSGEEAVMKVVTEYIYPTDYDVQLQSSSSGGGGYSGGGSQSAILAVVEPQSFTMREVGVILQVTPTLTDDGQVVDLELNTQVVDEPTWKNYGMKIPFTGNSQNLSVGTWPPVPTLEGFTPEHSQLESAWNSMMGAWVRLVDGLAAGFGGNQNITYYDAPMEQPFFHVRSVDSKVSVYPGATIVMGGLITEARKAMDDKIPFLGDIPFIGRLFRSHSEQTTKRNLLIFVTTRIVDGRGREIHDDGLEQDNNGGEVKAAPEVAAQ